MARLRRSWSRLPGVPPPAPTLVPPRPKPSGKKRLGWIVFLIVAAIGIERGVHYYANVRKPPEAAAAAVIRTGTVTQGLVQRTIRLTGTTGAERFSSLISPQLRGNRSGGGSRRKLPKRRRWRRWRQHGASVQFGRWRRRDVVIERQLRFFDHRNTGATGSAATTPSVTSTNGLQTGGGSQAFRSATSRVNSNRPTTSSSSTPGSNSSNSSPAVLLLLRTHPVHPQRVPLLPTAWVPLPDRSRASGFRWRRWRRRWRWRRWRRVQPRSAGCGKAGIACEERRSRRRVRSSEHDDPPGRLPCVGQPMEASIRKMKADLEVSRECACANGRKRQSRS